MPINRGIVYEEPLEQFLMENRLGEVSGGGTQQAESGEIEFCDIEIELKIEITDELLSKIILQLEKLGAPKGSKLKIENTDRVMEFGKNEGLAIYLDGKTLDPKVYAQNDINVLLEELYTELEIARTVDRFWEGPEETALYFYNDRFETMVQRIDQLVTNHPLCKNSRIVKIA